MVRSGVSGTHLALQDPCMAGCLLRELRSLLPCVREYMWLVYVLVRQYNSHVDRQYWSAY